MIRLHTSTVVEIAYELFMSFFVISVWSALLASGPISAGASVIWSIAVCWLLVTLIMTMRLPKQRGMLRASDALYVLFAVAAVGSWGFAGVNGLLLG